MHVCIDTSRMRPVCNFTRTTKCVKSKILKFHSRHQLEIQQMLYIDFSLKLNAHSLYSYSMYKLYKSWGENYYYDSN